MPLAPAGSTKRQRPTHLRLCLRPHAHEVQVGMRKSGEQRPRQLRLQGRGGVSGGRAAAVGALARRRPLGRQPCSRHAAWQGLVLAQQACRLASQNYIRCWAPCTGQVSCPPTPQSGQRPAGRRVEGGAAKSHARITALPRACPLGRRRRRCPSLSGPGGRAAQETQPQRRRRRSSGCAHLHHPGWVALARGREQQPLLDALAAAPAQPLLRHHLRLGHCLLHLQLQHPNRLLEAADVGGQGGGSASPAAAAAAAGLGPRPPRSEGSSASLALPEVLQHEAVHVCVAQGPLHRGARCRGGWVARRP